MRAARSALFPMCAPPASLYASVAGAGATDSFVLSDGIFLADLPVDHTAPPRPCRVYGAAAAAAVSRAAAPSHAACHVWIENNSAGRNFSDRLDADAGPRAPISNVQTSLARGTSARAPAPGRRASGARATAAAHFPSRWPLWRWRPAAGGARPPRPGCRAAARVPPWSTPVVVPRVASAARTVATLRALPSRPGTRRGGRGRGHP